MTSLEETCVITTGGLAEAINGLCNRPGLVLEGLISTHDEADMPLKLHCLHTLSADVVVC